MIRFALVLGLAGVTAGCFGFLGGGEPETTATVLVLNDLNPPSVLTIEMRRSGDDTETLGTVPAGEERTLTYSSSELQGNYQLIARQSSGASVTSRDFTLFAGARVQWQVGSNTLSVVESR
ncbi:MAG: hypothetical protein KFH98_00320 [Gemmatimonadetes bacterium]|nr:hypothetical protein [Gemmatimonadota bacterium]